MSYGTLISTVTVGAGGAASIDFTSIPSTYTDLMVVHSLRSSNTGQHDDMAILFNSSTTGYTAGRYLIGTGAAASSSSFPSSAQLWGGDGTGSSATANTFSSCSVYIPNYAGSQNKSASVDAVSENNATTAYQFISAGLWANSAAITSISIKPWGGSGTIQQYSSASLYGIKSGSGGATVTP